MAQLKAILRTFEVTFYYRFEARFLTETVEAENENDAVAAVCDGWLDVSKIREVTHA